MKKPLFPIILVICLFVTFLSCSNKSKKSRKPVSAITFTPNQKVYHAGNTVLINIATKLNGGELEKIELYYNEELLSTETKPDFSYELKGMADLGPNAIKVVTTKKDGSSNSRYKSFSVLSDITPPMNSYIIVGEHPHSIDFFTEGLLVHDGFLYESTGNHGTSAIYKTILNSGKVVSQKKLDDQYFGEGITILNDKIYQLTYKTKIGFVYNLADFALIDSFRISSEEGWGLTNDGVNLIMSDGTSKLTWIDTNTYQTVKYLYIADNTILQEGLNELEYVDGAIFANVWTKNYIIKIDAKTGKILSAVDLSKLLEHIPDKSNLDVLNGIAYNEAKGNFLVTGKFWPKIFEIKLIASK